MRKVVRTENFSFVIKDIRITHLVSTRSKKISHSCLVPSRSRSLCGEIWVNYEGKRGDHFPLVRALCARSHHPPLALLACLPCLQLSRFSLVLSLSLSKACGGSRSHSPFQNSLLLMCAIILHPFDPYMTSILYLPHWTACFLEHLKVNWFNLFLFNGVAVTHQMNKTSTEGTCLFQVFLSVGLIDATLCSGIQSFVASSTIKVICCHYTGTGCCRNRMLPESSCAATKTIPDRASVHVWEPWFSAISVTERSCVTPRRAHRESGSSHIGPVFLNSKS